MLGLLPCSIRCHMHDTETTTSDRDDRAANRTHYSRGTLLSYLHLLDQKVLSALPSLPCTELIVVPLVPI
jgi:hypothetical protein